MLLAEWSYAALSTSTATEALETAAGDLNADGRINVEDLRYMLSVLPESGPKLGLADLDADGFVGLDDLMRVLAHWNQNVPSGDPDWGDATGDGYVGVDDLSVVLDQWNTGTLPTVSIPEPSSTVWFLLPLLVIVLGARRFEELGRRQSASIDRMMVLVLILIPSLQAQGASLIQSGTRDWAAAAHYRSGGYADPGRQRREPRFGMDGRDCKTPPGRASGSPGPACKLASTRSATQCVTPEWAGRFCTKRSNGGSRRPHSQNHLRAMRSAPTSTGLRSGPRPPHRPSGTRWA